MNNWVDFKQLRESLSFIKILRHYNVELKPRGAQHYGFCPLPNHNGKRRSPSFSVNTVKKLFHCFGCGSKGNILDFIGLMEGVDIRDGAALRSAVVAIQQEFLPQEESI